MADVTGYTAGGFGLGRGRGVRTATGVAQAEKTPGSGQSTNGWGTTAPTTDSSGWGGTGGGQSNSVPAEAGWGATNGAVDSGWNNNGAGDNNMGPAARRLQMTPGRKTPAAGGRRSPVQAMVAALAALAAEEVTEVVAVAALVGVAEAECALAGTTEQVEEAAAEDIVQMAVVQVAEPASNATRKAYE
ncbi:uncharacterized protein LOC119432646 isoform X1 [Dermacentor silvarum]|uniref:uncharacterized protein LOC119432646 isoform X1 n=1 Tax=Dermacentor silvarum TaxID=543639 RepID=UPI00189923D6|nr:uncharacterized protein LOC119432646 isoform X1 [Dermacentor silvarum]